MVRRGTAPRALRRAFGQAGYTLIETLVVMTLLIIVIGALADGFTNASRTEADQTARADDQEAARQALERLRRDIHCASAGSVSPTGTTLNLTVNPNQCLAVTTSASDGVQWCTVPVAGVSNRYVLYRTIVSSCSAAGSVFQVDYLTSPTVWSVTCAPSHLEAIAIDMSVNRDYATRPGRTYRLQDTIALRNDTALSGALTGC